ncbi:MAG: addiction module protein [Candidatus Latescibacterota bacterium]
MSPHVKQVLDDALKLSPVDRAELVERILASFPFPERERIDALWAAEAEDRIDAYERGDVASTPAHEVFARIQRSGP